MSGVMVGIPPVQVTISRITVGTMDIFLLTGGPSGPDPTKNSTRKPNQRAETKQTIWAISPKTRRNSAAKQSQADEERLTTEP
ncbi:hypothetical protein YC2023_038301 [Brassica napus]